MNDAEYADKAVEELEEKFRDIYRQARREIRRKLIDFENANYLRELEWSEMLKNGEKTRAEFEHWKRTQLYAGQSWENQKKSIAYALENSNEIANRMINDQSIDVFAYGGNYAAYEFEDGFKVHIGFDLYDRSTVQNLIKNDPKILPPKKLDPIKDVRWNMKNIASQVTLGIIQGESVKQVAKRLASVVTDRNEKQMLLHARTAMTSAHNAGRMARYKEAQALGIEFKKVWLSTHDGRARELHLGLDEQAVKPEEAFEIDGYEIMYPGDPDAEPEMVYNCRCTLVTELDKYPSKYAKESIEEPKSFENWLDQLIAEEEAERMAIPLVELAKIKDAMGKKSYEEYYKMINENEYVKGLYQLYGNDFSVNRLREGGYYTSYSGTVNFSYSKESEGSRYATIAHEFGHGFDHHGRGNFGVSYGEVDTINNYCGSLDGLGLMDTVDKRLSASDEYLAAMRKDAKLLEKLLNDPSVVRSLNMDDASSGVQDFADGLFGTQSRKDEMHLRWGHGEKYYDRRYNSIRINRKEDELVKAYNELGIKISSPVEAKPLIRNFETASELWANQISALTTGGRALEYMEKYAPNSLEALKKILKQGNY